MLRRHGLVPFALLAVFIIIATAVDLVAAKDDLPIEWIDRYGDRTALEGITVQTAVRDSYHRTNIQIASGKVSYDTEIFDQYRDGYSRYRGVFSKLFGSLEVQVWSSFFELHFTLRQLTDPVDSRSFQIKHGYGERTQGGHSRYINPLEYGLASLPGKLFYVLPTSLHHQLSNVIYKTDLEAEELEAERFIELDLSDNDAKNSRGLEVLGLEASGEQLVLILREDRHKLVIRGYDHKSGELQGEVVIEEFMEHDTRFEAYPDHENKKLILSFHRYEEGSSNREPALTLLCFDLKDGVRLIDEVRTVFADGEYVSGLNLMSAGHVNGKLVVAMTVREFFEEQEAQMHNRFYPPIRFMLYVFEGGELVYKGELGSGLNDDLIHFRNSREIQHYDSNRQRRYEFISIQ